METLLKLDGGVLLWIQQNLRCPALSALLCPLTKLGNAGILWIAVSLVLLLLPRTRRMGLLSLGALAAGFIVTNLGLKPLIHRPRPWLTVEGLTALVSERDPASFPSGHASAAFAACCVWAEEAPRRYAPWLLAAAAVMSFSRLYVGVHFPTDVLVGAIIGMAAALLIHSVDRRIHVRR